MSNRQLYILNSFYYFLFLFEKVVDLRTSFSYPNWKTVFYCLVLKDESLTSFLTPAGQENCYVFLMCSLEIDLHFQ